MSRDDLIGTVIRAICSIKDPPTDAVTIESRFEELDVD